MTRAGPLRYPAPMKLAPLLPVLPVLLATAAGADPTIRFEQEEHDFGAVARGATAEHAFAFRNAGDAPLHVLGALAVAEGMEVEWPEAPIAPDAGGAIRVRFSPKRTGPFAVAIVVRTDDPLAVSRVLRIRGAVVP